MTRNGTTDRRSFLKKTATTTALVGGLTTSAQTVTASNPTLELEGVSGTSNYNVAVNTTNVTPRSDVEDSVDIRKGSDKTIIDGSVDAGETDTFDFEGNVTDCVIDGNMWVNVYNVWGMNRQGEITVEGTDSSYLVSVSDRIEKQGQLESGDELRDRNGDGEMENAAGELGWSDTDKYYGYGGIYAINADTSSGNTVQVTHNL